jgi:membrane protein DedA with SNARE-associated domain
VIYFSIVLFAILEGEIYYSARCAQTMTGDLAWFPVMVAGAIGGAAGDQIWFYVLRGRIHWFDRYPKLAKYRARISNHVHSHETAMILVGRFLPGLRTAIPVACAYANVSRVKFSLLNLVSAFAWAGAIMLLVRGGSRTLSAFGLDAWWGPFIPAAVIVLFFRWLSRPTRHTRT